MYPAHSGLSASVNGGRANVATGEGSTISGGGQTIGSTDYGLTETRDWGWRAGNSAVNGVPKYSAP
jgi:hypothetical protein